MKLDNATTNGAPTNRCAWRDVAVIGGGVAGTAAAIRLRRHGVDVTVIERAVFPRHKVCGCCIGGAGLDVLGHLGCDGQVRNVARSLDRWMGSIGGHAIDVQLSDNIAISRESLDVILIEEAIRLGASVRQPAVGSIGRSTKDGIEVFIKGSDGEGSARWFDGVVFAGGLTSSSPSCGKLSDALPWITKPHGPFGVSYLVDDVSGFPDDAVMMVCDHDGYVGLVRLEDGRIDVAAALRSGRAASLRGKPAERIAAILSCSSSIASSTWFDEAPFRSANEVRTTAPLRRSRVAASGRVLAIGDAAGYVEPFTGEGMTWAMAGGIGVADWIAGSRCPADRVSQGWTNALTKLLRRQRRECRMVSSALTYPVTRGLIGAVLSKYPAAARPVLSHLGQPIRFPPVPSASRVEPSS